MIDVTRANEHAVGGERGSPELVSVVVPVRNAASVLSAQLRALGTQEFGGDWEVIVVDNGSTDGSADVARTFAVQFPRLKVVGAPHRRGASHARNVGARTARGDFIVFCDADDVVSTQWVSAMVARATDFDIVGGAVLCPPVGAEGGRLETALHSDELPGGSDFLPHVFSGNCGIWATTLSWLGGWNESYLIGEDVELSWRAQLRGCRIGFAPDAIVWRHDPAGSFALMRRSFRYGNAGARLHREFDARDPRRNIVEAVRALGWLVMNGPRSVYSEDHRRRWTNVLGRRVGRLAGSVRYRIFYP